MRRVLAIIGVGAALAVAGCGGDEEETEPAPGGGGTATEETTPAPTEESGGTTAGADGKQLFTVTCGGCHTLGDAGTSGRVGPNLDEVKPDEDTVKRAIETGPGAMPENLLEGANRDAVAAYVADVAGS